MIRRWVCDCFRSLKMTRWRIGGPDSLSKMTVTTEPDKDLQHITESSNQTLERRLPGIIIFKRRDNLKLVTNCTAIIPLEHLNHPLDPQHWENKADLQSLTSTSLIDVSTISSASTKVGDISMITDILVSLCWLPQMTVGPIQTISLATCYAFRKKLENQYLLWNPHRHWEKVPSNSKHVYPSFLHRCCIFTIMGRPRTTILYIKPEPLSPLVKRLLFSGLMQTWTVGSIAACVCKLPHLVINLITTAVLSYIQTTKCTAHSYLGTAVCTVAALSNHLIPVEARRFWPGN